MAKLDARTQLIMLLQTHAQPWSTSTPEQVADAIIAAGWQHIAALEDLERLRKQLGDCQKTVRALVGEGRDG